MPGSPQARISRLRFLSLARRQTPTQAAAAHPIPALRAKLRSLCSLLFQIRPARASGTSPIDNFNKPSDIRYWIVGSPAKNSTPRRRTTTEAALMAARNFGINHERQVDQIVAAICNRVEKTLEARSAGQPANGA